MHTDLLHLQRYHDSGDAGEFQALVRHHAGMVLATARRITRDASLAEDVAQETFLELARKGRSIKDSVGAWLHKVALRRACDVVRAETTRQRYEMAAEDLKEGRECTWEELEPVFDEAISELALEQRTVIIEHYLEGRSQTEIAGWMGTSQSSVSRLLDQSITELRSKLKGKGMFCGVALAGMIAASSAQAVPATLMASLQKIGISSIGASGAAATTTAATLSSLMGLRIAAVAALVVAACVVGFDMGAKDPIVPGTVGLSDSSAAGQPGKRAVPSASRNVEDPAAKNARLLADAKAIWDKMGKLMKAGWQNIYGDAIREPDGEKKLELLRSIGFTLSRDEYDGVIARHPNVELFDERKAHVEKLKLFNDLLATWSRESPLEFVAWSTLRGSVAGYAYPAVVTPWVQRHPDEWAAFVEAGPDPMLGECAKLWVEDMDDHGSIWAKASAAGMKLEFIEAGLLEFLHYGEPAGHTFRLIMRAPDATVRRRAIMGIATKLSSEQLLEAASSGQFEAGLAHTLSAMGGNSKAAFGIAGKWVNESAGGGGYDAQQAVWTAEAIRPFYAQWLKADAKAALQHAVRATNKNLLDQFMMECAQSPLLTEALMVESFTSPTNRERALAAYYQARAGGDPVIALQTIMNSSFSQDQIECAKAVLQQWTVQSAPGAAAWVAKLPESEDRSELVAAVVSKWAETAPEEAFAFAQQQGVALGDGWVHGMAWGARMLADDKLPAILLPLQSDPHYNEMLAGMVGYRCPGQPQEAFALLAKYGAPGWQASMMDFIVHWLQEGDDSRTEKYAAAMPAMDLSQVDPQTVSKAANLFVGRLASQGKLKEGLDWTLKLPAQVALQARLEAMSRLSSGDAKQQTAARQWIRSALISDGERASLLEQVNLRADGSAGTR